MTDQRYGRRTVLATLGAAVTAGCGGRATGTGSPTPARATGTTTDDAAPTTRSDSPVDATTTAASNLALDAPASVRQDRPVDLRVTGASAGQRVTLEATMDDYRGTTWTSETTFEADADGVVDPGSQAPADGGYEGVDPMGWLWSMTGPTRWPFAHSFRNDRTSVRLRASTPDGSTRTDLTLRLGAPGVRRTTVGADDVVGVLYEPSGDGPHPGVLALHGSGGRLPLRRARLLASAGYATLALQYFGPEDPIPDSHDGVPLSYVERAQSWLRGRERVRDGQVGVVGISRGGELALLLGARFGWVGAVVSYVGSGVGWEGGLEDPPNPAWTHEGDPVPHLTWKGDPGRTDAGNYRSLPMMTRRLESVGDQRLREATFAVEATAGPVLLISAGDDQVWPSTRLSRIAAERLRANDFGHPFEHLQYPDAGHFVTAPYLPTANRRVVDQQLFGGTPAGYARADAGSWPRVLKYLRTGLGD